jgi:hypothetical protein
VIESHEHATPSDRGHAEAAGSAILNFYGQYQETLVWCWAATTVSINLYYSPASGWTQCALANTMFRRSDCCNPQKPNACLQAGYIESALYQTGNLDYAQPSGANYVDVVGMINAARPIAIAINWVAGGGHSLSIYGYWYDDSTNRYFMYVCDPYWGNSIVDYTTFPANYYGGATWAQTCWTKNYYNEEKKEKKG